jgi:hypothetical protein
LKSILDASFRYVPSVETDVRKTFERIRREQRAQARSKSEDNAKTNVRQLRAANPHDQQVAAMSTARRPV